MEFKELVTAFGEKYGIEELSADDGAFSLDIDGMQIEVFHNEVEDTLFICGVIGEAPAEGMDRFGTLLLEANFLFQGTDGATLSRNPDTKEYALVRALPLALLDVDSFSSALEKFINGLESWIKLLTDFRPIEAEAEKSAQESVPLGSFLQV